MNPDRQQAIAYLRAPSDGLWRWAEDGAVVVWRDGSTIAFREEIVRLIEWLAPNQLPSFGAIVFLLAACRGKRPGVKDLVMEPDVPLPPAMGKDAVILLTARRQLRAQLEAALAQLEKIPGLPNELTSGLKARCVLAEAVFEPAKVERHVEARAILLGLRERMSEAELIDAEQVGAGGSYIRQIHIVSEGLKRHTAESLQLRLRTGLDALPKEADANLPVAERARRLIEELSRDREYGSVARAARELMAAVRLPRRLAEREQLAIGGVADITNRGPLDRLLLSELAHDDLTLSARVALNEALYLRREPPMREPPGALALLLDSGVRLWGTPRVLAAAVALALVARDKQHSEILAWRAHGKQLRPVDLLSRSGLTQHLGTLETTAHPGESMPAFAEAVPPGAQNQSILITHRDSLDDPEFRRALAESPSAPGFVATVSREGRFELHALPLARRAPVCEADLDLDSVFDQRTAVSPIKVDIDPNLPAILGVVPFPFLLPVTGRVDDSVAGRDGFVYALMNDRRLVQFRNERSGGRVLASDLPGGSTIWMDIVNDTVHVVKVGSAQRPTRLLSFSVPDGKLRVIDLVSGDAVRAVHRYGDVIMVIRRSDSRAYALSDGRLLGHTVNPHPNWLNGRFFRGANQFHFAVWDGERVMFAPVTLSRSYSPSVIATVFDRRGIEGPWLVHQSGIVVSTVSGEQHKLPMPTGRSFGLDEVKISRDGHRVCYSVGGPEFRRVKDLMCGTVIEGPRLRSAEALLDHPPGLPSWNLYRTIEAVTRMPDGLGLCGRKRWRKLGLDANGKLRITDLGSELRQPSDELNFKDPPRKTSYGCSLQLAKSTSGVKVFVDSRGLLHLKSHDPNVPEVSLLLADGEVAGWTSSGFVCGQPFFFDGPYVSQPAEVFECLKRILAYL